MTKVLNLGCGSDHHPDALNVDAEAACNPDEQRDLTDYPWPWSDVVEIRMYHVLEHLSDIERALREVERTLVRGGRLVAKLPVGLDARADPGHLWGEGGQPWTWRTPDLYCGERHWDVDVGLDVARKDVELWSVHPSRYERAWHQAKWKWKLRRFGPDEWCFSLPHSCGEFTVVFEK